MTHTIAAAGVEAEGTVKFAAQHRQQALDHCRFGRLGTELIAWREILVRLGLVGQAVERYGGAGFGNLSGRIGPFPGRRSGRPFLITGTQTGGRQCMALDAFCVVTEYDIAANRVVSYGPVVPSSESMSHGAIYDLGPHIRYVVHVHCPVLWSQAGALHLPTAAANVAYGTPEMAREIGRLHASTALADLRILIMAGHEDGVVVFGRTIEETGATLMQNLGRAYMRVCSAQGQLCTPRGLA